MSAAPARPSADRGPGVEPAATPAAMPAAATMVAAAVPRVSLDGRRVNRGILAFTVVMRGKIQPRGSGAGERSGHPEPPGQQLVTGPGAARGRNAVQGVALRGATITRLGVCLSLSVTTDCLALHPSNPKTGI